MQTQEKILTKNPDKNRIGRNIDKQKYTAIRKAIIDCLNGKKLTHTELVTCISKKVGISFRGSIDWYGQIVKKDLEAEKIIERTGEKPQRYKLK